MKIMTMTVIFLHTEYFEPQIFSGGFNQAIFENCKIAACKSNSGKVPIQCLVKSQFNLDFVTTGCSYITSANLLDFVTPSPPPLVYLKNFEC